MFAIFAVFHLDADGELLRAARPGRVVDDPEVVGGVVAGLLHQGDGLGRAGPGRLASQQERLQ